MAATPNSIITPQTPNVLVGKTLMTANTAKDGTGTTVVLYTAGPNGSKLSGVQIAFTGNNIASVLRLFVNNGSGSGIAANNSLYQSVSIPANSISEVAAAPDFYVPLPLTLPAGYTLIATLGTTIASPIAVTANGGDL